MFMVSKTCLDHARSGFFKREIGTAAGSLKARSGDVYAYGTIGVA